MSAITQQDPTNRAMVDGREVVLDPTHKSNVECPFPMYKHLREQAPVAHIRDHDFYMVTTHDLCMEVLRDPATFRQWDGDEMFGPGEGPPLGRPSNWSPEVRAAMEGAYLPTSTLVNANPPRHTRYRKLANKLFSARRTADDMEDRLRELVDELIDSFPVSGEADFVDVFAVPFPIRVISEVLGFPADQYRTFKRWTDSAMVAIAGGVDTDRLVEAANDIVEFQGFLLEMVESRRKEPKDDVVGYLANAQLQDVDGPRPLNERETIGIGLHLLTGGGETTTNLLGNLMHRITAEPGLLERIKADNAIIPQVIEETLRVDSPFQALFRRTTRAVTLGGVDLPEGAKVLVTFGSANHDEAHFPDGDDFDVDRPEGTPHIAFGFGTHFCLGAPLARREAKLALEALTRRLPGLRAKPGGEVVQHEHAFLRGLRRFDIQYDAVLPASGAAR
ncbi:cytochrome P450 [Georgenia yuyongxinii]|uniref:Cytochrome P450 n=1 Tax=Georgenia yuyongxinii TaxID=2589797 RepID=A0A552WY71_9MICO|nr:cytochrome P450 [Georgenia yuyongxinii]TRW47625.1 cytochrome P450 [Georgenia yuyongxinii]